jgi:hypothetical protein
VKGGGVKSHIGMSATTTVALPTRTSSALAICIHMKDLSIGLLTCCFRVYLACTLVATAAAVIESCASYATTAALGVHAAVWPTVCVCVGGGGGAQYMQFFPQVDMVGRHHPKGY